MRHAHSSRRTALRVAEMDYAVNTFSDPNPDWLRGWEPREPTRATYTSLVLRVFGGVALILAIAMLLFSAALGVRELVALGRWIGM